RLAFMVHAPAPKIVATAQAVAARLETARDLLAPNAIDIDITAAEGALSFGVPGDAIKMVRAVRPNQSVAVPLAVLTQLVTSHVSAKQAANIVTELMKRGANNVQLVALGNDVDGDVGRGALPSSSLYVRMRGLTATLSPPPASSTGPGITGLA